MRNRLNFLPLQPIKSPSGKTSPKLYPITTRRIRSGRERPVQPLTDRPVLCVCLEFDHTEPSREADHTKAKGNNDLGH